MAAVAKEGSTGGLGQQTADEGDKDNKAAAYYTGGTVVANPGLCKRQAVREELTPDSSGVILAMVGLPARGKSFISRKVERFMQWKGLKTRMFNVGRYRRDATAPEQSGRSDFFDASNAAAKAAREAAASAALVDALDFLDRGGEVVVLDATNSTLERRNAIRSQVDAHGRRYSLIFVEVICDDPETLEANAKNKVSNSPDFSHLTFEEAQADLLKRIQKYADVYETVRDDEGAFIKLYNLSSKVMANHCYGRISKTVVPYLMAIHIGARPIWLVRALQGEGSNPEVPDSPQGNGCDRLAKLSLEGRNSAHGLADLVRARAAKYWEAIGRQSENMHVITSTMPRAIASVCHTNVHHEQTAVLNPIDKGAIGSGWWDVECGGDLPPWEEFERRHPEAWATWREDPLRCHFPGGESYMDVLRRLEGFLIEVEMCTRPVLIVSHITTLQLLVAYFRGTPIEEAWRTPIQKGVVLEVTPSLGGGFICEELPIPQPTAIQLLDAASSAAPDAASKESTDVPSEQAETHGSRDHSAQARAYRLRQEADTLRQRAQYMLCEAEHAEQIAQHAEQHAAEQAEIDAERTVLRLEQELAVAQQEMNRQRQRVLRFKGEIAAVQRGKDQEGTSSKRFPSIMQDGAGVQDGVYKKNPAHAPACKRHLRSGRSFFSCWPFLPCQGS